MNYYPEENADDDEEHKDFVNESQQPYNQKSLSQNSHQRVQYFDYIKEKSNSPHERNDNSAELEQRWILAMSAIGLLPGKAI